MCGRFTLRTPMNRLAERFRFETSAELSITPRYNIAPTQDVLAIRQHDGQRCATFLRWGLIPSWAKEVGTGTINARSETLVEKPMFRNLLKRKRCLVIADGYYEWRTEGKAKLPLFYEVERGEPFAFAALWDSWQGLETCSLITTRANELAKAVHDRMPVILHDSDYDAWLDPSVTDPAYVLEPYEEAAMSVRPASHYVNSSRHEGPECLALEPG